MKNLFINNLNEKDINHFTTNAGLYIRKKIDKPFKKLCNIFTNANIIKCDFEETDDKTYYENLDTKKIDNTLYNIKNNKNNIVLERYPKLEKDESYIFVCNHTCPEDIETVLNIIDRNAYLVLGSVESLKYNPEMYLSFLNGMIPFDILDNIERKQLMPKMKKVLQTNSILIFPEGSHNYSPNNLINTLFDGPVNLAMQTNKKIVLLTLVKDQKNNVSFVNASNPIDVSRLNLNVSDYYREKENCEKYIVKSISSYLRDLMATSVYYTLQRHFDILKRENYNDIESEFREEICKDVFSKLKWNHDVFDAEYLTKKTIEEKEYENVISDLSKLGNKEYTEKKVDLDSKNVPNFMRNYWNNHNKKSKTLRR